MSSPFQYREAVRRLRAGAVVAHPTEAVYGLACNPVDLDAVTRLLALKGRPAAKGFILIADHFDALLPFVAWSESALPETVRRSWPGPHTWLLPAAPGVPPWLTGDRPTLAVRITAHPVAAELCRRFGGPLVSTSANLSGRPPARTPLQVLERCPGVDFLLHGATGGLDRPTPIRDARTGRLVRP